MAKADNNVILSHLSGSIGNQITIRQTGGKTIVSKKQRKSRKRLSPMQVQVKVNFKGTSRRAMQLLNDPDLKDFYESVKRGGQTAYNMAVKDVSNPPEIESINADLYSGKAGEQIIIRAIDVFRVYRVTVTIYSADDVLLEQGNAIIARNGKDWSYTTTKANKVLKGAKIAAEAEDVPGNITTSEITL
jgi:hypothetical protein